MKNGKAGEERENRWRVGKLVENWISDGELESQWRMGKLIKNWKSNEPESWWRTKPMMIHEERESRRSTENWWRTFEWRTGGDVRLLCNVARKIVMLPLENYVEAWNESKDFYVCVHVFILTLFLLIVFTFIKQRIILFPQ